jgi:hypothetical protein
MVPLFVGLAIGTAGAAFDWPITDQLIIYAAVVIVWALEKRQ